MTRKDVYKLIDGEREYQDSLPHHSTEKDANHGISDWILYIERHLDYAKMAVYNMGEVQALAEIRKIAALAVACMENNDTPARGKS